MMNYLLIGLGSALGGMARFWLSGAIAQRFGESFPMGTLVVNVSGSLLIGFIASLAGTESRFLLHSMPRQFLMIGVLGGYTTFSSFSLQTLNLAQAGQWLYAAMNILFSVVLCLVGTWFGWVLGQLVNRSL